MCILAQYLLIECFFLLLFDRDAKLITVCVSLEEPQAPITSLQYLPKRTYDIVKHPSSDDHHQIQTSELSAHRGSRAYETHRPDDLNSFSRENNPLFTWRLPKQDRKQCSRKNRIRSCDCGKNQQQTRALLPRCAFCIGTFLLERCSRNQASNWTMRMTVVISSPTPGGASNEQIHSYCALQAVIYGVRCTVAIIDTSLAKKRPNA